MTEPRLLGDRYELGEVLGRGGMAEVRRGRDLRLGRIVAIKMLRVDHAADATFQARFRREAQSAASLNHRNIVAVYDTGEDYLDGHRIPYIVMEYVEGRTLRELLREQARFTPERTIEVTASILDALEYSHRGGIVHRDIKPENILFSAGHAVVSDFGIARAVGAAGVGTPPATGLAGGTPAYLSPAQWQGNWISGPERLAVVPTTAQGTANDDCCLQGSSTLAAPGSPRTWSARSRTSSARRPPTLDRSRRTPGRQRCRPGVRITLRRRHAKLRRV